MSKFNRLAERYRDDVKQQHDIENMRMGAICAAVYNAAGAKKKNGQPFTATDFVTQEKKQQTVSEQKEILMRAGVK